ncbi:similar to NADP+-specific isocitrate dehydrogenase, isoform CRA_d [Rattus norvegicus]|uniref:Similar to NADP+-specific isocitrate dehydrogenase, isoform CRA_d n=1 Tax=Rattus norvegicus TaxID=10116 RepID=A6JC83_RAT|nr:similar to NADP+-specific isocitrate dehydrogenase, isoform CRA_d [Rattus norvegicus]
MLPEGTAVPQLPCAIPTWGGCFYSVLGLVLRFREGPLTCQIPVLSPRQVLLPPGTIRLTLTRIRSGTSIGSLTTWWLRCSSLPVALCGPARTMTEMYSLTSWLKDLAPLA